MNIRCSSHRLLPWLGHGECLNCQRTFKRILSADEICFCGVRLLPKTKLIAEVLMQALWAGYDERSFFGRPMCAKCFESRAMEDIPVC